MNLFKSRAAGPVSIYRPDETGNLVLVETRPAGSIDDAKISAEDLRGKPGRKKGSAANTFASGENQY